MKGPIVMSVSFGDDDTIELVWTDLAQHSDFGAAVHTEVITTVGQMTDEQVTYWSRELRQSADEFLGAWRNYVRDNARR